MKVLIVTALLVSGSGLLGQNDMSVIQGLRNAVAELERDKAGVYMETAPQFLGQLPAFKSLQAQAPGIWQIALEHFDEIATNPNQKQILLYSFEGLSPDEYLNAVDRMTAMTQEGRLASKHLQAAISPIGALRGFFVFNYQHPRVRSVLLSVKSVLPAEAPTRSLIDDILSGERKRYAEGLPAAYRNEYGKPPILPMPTATPDANRDRPSERVAPSGAGSEPTTESSLAPSPANSAGEAPSATSQTQGSGNWLLVGTLLLAIVLGGIIVRALRR
jgi:hypothetical protein